MISKCIEGKTTPDGLSYSCRVIKGLRSLGINLFYKNGDSKKGSIRKLQLDIGFSKVRPLFTYTKENYSYPKVMFMDDVCLHIRDSETDRSVLILKEPEHYEFDKLKPLKERNNATQSIRED